MFDGNKSSQYNTRQTGPQTQNHKLQEELLKFGECADWNAMFRALHADAIVSLPNILASTTSCAAFLLEAPIVEILKLVKSEQLSVGDLSGYQDWCFVQDLARTLHGTVNNLQDQVVEACTKFATTAIAFTESAAAFVFAAVLQHGTGDTWNEAALATSKCKPMRTNMCIYIYVRV